MNIRLITITLLLLLFSSKVCSQQTGEVEYPYLGIKFKIPSQWKGQEIEDGYIMGSDTKPGLIVMSTHESKTVEELRMEARQGFQIAEGTMFQLASELENIGNSGIGGTFSGLMDWQQANGFIIGIVNPLGNGVVIMALTTPEFYSEEYEKLAKDLANSLKFSKPKESPVAKEWSQTLKGAKLTYMSSFGDSDYSGGYSGGSTTEEIILCSNQSFSFYYNSSYSMSTSSADAFSAGNDAGKGTWAVETSGNGDAELVLNYLNGKTSRYTISYVNEETLLNDTRYFRTYDHGVCR